MGVNGCKSREKDDFHHPFENFGIFCEVEFLHAESAHINQICLFPCDFISSGEYLEGFDFVIWISPVAVNYLQVFKGIANTVHDLPKVQVQNR